ncbi:MAG: ABC transporter ATP-binding protein/permease [Spirochaetaceae bacterium]|jgi:ABC-type multidrug transport system fused ATPase/permease subunit|nr:ABC transporter ATP-binding protein/permease [Spirochaetaceae bacterium]
MKEKKPIKSQKLFAGLGFLLSLYWKYRKSTLLFLALFCLLSGLLPFASIIIPKFILDELINEQNIIRIAVAVVVLLFSTLFGESATDFFHSRYEIGQQYIADHFAVDMGIHLYKSDLASIEKASFLDTLTRSAKFMNAEYTGFGGVLLKAANIVSYGITTIGIISIISLLNPFIMLIFIGLGVITTIFNAHIKKKLVALSLEHAAMQRKVNYDFSLFEGNRFAKEVRINNMLPWITKRYSSSLGAMFDLSAKQWNLGLHGQLFTNSVTVIQQGIAYAYLVYSVIQGQFGIGSFMMYLGAINTFSGSITSLMNAFVDLRRYTDYYDAVKEFFDTPQYQRAGKDACSLSAAPEIEFRNVSFHYANQKDTLKNINITIHAGEKLAIVGENGAGKTTLIKLLIRLYKPTEGEILLNGKNIQDYDFDEYVKQISIVFQDFALFAVSLRENITVGRSIDDKEIIAVLERSGFSERLARLEKGLDTTIYKTLDDNGIELSAGEGQKIAMARALLKDTPLIILDEPSASLDPRAEYEIYQQFNQMVSGKTALFISHRLSSTQFCDKIAVLKQGRLVEYGTHPELMQRKQLYHELFSMQAQFYETKREI